MTNDNDQLKNLTRIIQSAALKSTAADQVDFILERLSETLNVDVCSLYRKLNDTSLSMVSTYGLKKTHPVVIPPKKGLVGKVISSQHAINIIEPSSNPDYFYLADSNEEELHSFCGVPVFTHGEVSGVLVVQSFQPVALDMDQEALLATLAIHLGLLLDSIESAEIRRGEFNLTIEGVSGSSGLAIGRAFVLTADSLFDVLNESSEDVEKALADWCELKEKAKQAFREEKDILQKEVGESLSSLFDAYIQMLEDPSFNDLIKSEINKGCTLQWALKKAVSHFAEMFQAMDDPYLQARSEDVEHLGESLYRLWSGDQEGVISYPDEPIVLVGRTISVSTIAKLISKKLTGIVCTEGAALSHIAVFANALGIPAVLGTGNIPLSVNHDLIVDGDSGQVVVNPDHGLLAEYKKLISDKQTIANELLKNVKDQAQTKDGKILCLMANSGLHADFDSGLKYGAEGIGLYRTEIPFMVSSSLPSEEDQYSLYKKVLEKYQAKPVYFRTLDIGSDKPLPYLPAIHEENPALGLRGIRYTLRNLSMLDSQLNAILRASQSCGNVYLIFPMLSYTEQLNQCLALLEERIAELNKAGLQIARPKVGVMMEVPSCISLLPLWKDKIDFISIGTNDLTQYLLAVDRNNSLVNNCFDHLHPAVLHELDRIAKLCEGSELEFSVCGELASIPLATVYLVGMGFKKFSLSATKIPIIKELMRYIDSEQAKIVLGRALKVDNAAAIHKISEEFLASLNLPFANLLYESR